MQRSAKGTGDLAIEVHLAEITITFHNSYGRSARISCIDLAMGRSKIA